MATVGDYFSGRHLPLDRELLARILAVLGVTDPALVERWQLALARVRRQPGRRSAPPYRGLAPFEASDARLFFGRDDVIRLLESRAADPAGLPLLLIGPSGAGKSSVLRAGLAPRLAQPVPTAARRRERGRAVRPDRDRGGRADRRGRGPGRPGGTRMTAARGPRSSWTSSRRSSPAVTTRSSAAR